MSSTDSANEAKRLSDKELIVLYEQEIAERAKERELLQRGIEKWRRKGQGDGEREPIEASPWLLARAVTTDLGQRPLPPTTAFWLSPDIWVEGPGGSAQPVAGKPNYVVARLFNLGMFTAAPVKVRFHWFHPAVGLLPSQLHTIGTEYLEIRSLKSAVIRCRTPWIPEFINDGHECLFVDCTTTLDPMTDPFAPSLDRHIAQRNVTVLPGAPGVSNLITLEFVNVLWTRTEIEVRAVAFLVRADSLKGATSEVHWQAMAIEATLPPAVSAKAMRVLYAPGTAAARSAATIARHLDRIETNKTARRPPRAEMLELEGLDVRAKVSDRLAPLGKKDRDTAFAASLAASTKAFTEPQPQPAFPRAKRILEPLVMDGFERRRLEIEWTTPEAAPGDTLVLHIEQTAGNLSIGGYTMVVRMSHREGDKQIEEGSMATKDSDERLTQLIVDEVDEARETLELAQQLAPHLPLEGFEQLRKLGDGKGLIQFRGRTFDIAGFGDLVPEFLFPIKDEAALVAALYQVVKLAPATITYDMEKPENARREMRRIHMRRLSGSVPLGQGSMRGAPIAANVKP